MLEILKASKCISTITNNSSSSQVTLQTQNCSPQTYFSLPSSISETTLRGECENYFYPEMLLFKNISLSLERGSLVVVRGPSGCGKTTFLKCIAHLDQFDEGEMRLNGKNVYEVYPTEWHSKVFYLPQKPPKFDGLTPLQTLEEMASFKGLKTKFSTLKERLIEGGILKELKLPQRFLHDDWAGLSGGEAQRMIHALTMTLEPEVVLLDEPTAALDRESAMAVEGFYGKRRSNLVIFWVTHSDEQAMRLSPSHEMNFEEFC